MERVTPAMAVDFLTQDHRVSGHIRVRAKPVLEILNDGSDFVELDSTYVSALNRAAEIGTSTRQTSLRKAAIRIAVVAGREDAVGKGLGATPALGKALRSVFLSVAGFAVKGQVLASTQADPTAVILAGLDRFLPIFEAQAWPALLPDTRFQGAVLIVNRGQIDFLSF